MQAAGYMFYMQMKELEEEPLHKDVFAVAPLKKQQMCTGADPEASHSRAVGQQQRKPCHPWSKAHSEEWRADGQGCEGMEKSECVGRGRAVRGFEDKEKDFVVCAVLRASAGVEGGAPPGSCV